MNAKITLRNESLHIQFDYDPKLVELVKSLSERKFDPTSKIWTAPVSIIDEVVSKLPASRFEYSDDLKSRIDEIKARNALVAKNKIEQAARVSAALNLDAPYGDKVLYAHQKIAAQKMVEQGRLILADDMGLGKTLSVLVAAKAYRDALGYKIIVIAPVSLRDNWLREAENSGVEISVFSWAKIPESIDGAYVLICDEAHYAQSLKATRTQKMLDLAKSARAVFLLTGTPIKNGRPVNLFPLLKATQHSLARDKSGYEKRYCNAHATRFTAWDTTGAAHLDELHEKTRDIILRRMKKECLDLPEKTRVLRHVELSPDAKSAYDAAFKKLRDEYLEKLERGEISEGADAIVLLNHLRHAGSIAKTETAIEIAEEILENGGQVVLFTEFKESAALLHEKLGGEIMTGDTPTDERQSIVDRFQNGQSRVFVGTIKAGGVGITLTAAATVILVDRPWTPGDAEQAEDRLHRIGQNENVTALWLQANGCDESIDAILLKKQERIELVLHGKRKTMRGTGSINEIAREVACAIFE